MKSKGLTKYDRVNLLIKLWKNNEFDYFLPKDDDGNIIPFPKQKAAWKIIKGRKIKTFAYGGASGGAKTHTDATAMIMEHLSISGLHSAVCRNELKDLTNTTFVSFMDTLALYKIPYGKEHGLLHYNEKKNCWIFNNGSRIFFLSVEFKPSDPTYEWLGSYMLSYVWFEEAQQIHFQAYVKMGQRVGRQVALYKKIGYVINQILITMNPSKNWVYNLLYLPQKNGTLEKKKLFMKALAKDNPTLSKEYMTALDEIPDPIERAKQRDGEWEYDDSEKALFTHMSITKMFDYEDLKDSGTMYITCDPAGRGQDEAVLMLWKGYCVIGVAIAKKSTRQDIEAVIDNWKDKHVIPNEHIFIDAIGLGEYLVDSYEECFIFKANSLPIIEFMGNNSERSNKTKSSPYYRLRDQVFNVAAELTEKEIPQFSTNLEIIKFGKYPESFSYNRNTIMAEFRKELEPICETTKIDAPKKKITTKEDIKNIIQRSPNYSDCWSMRFITDTDSHLNVVRQFTATAVPTRYDSEYYELQQIAG